MLTKQQLSIDTDLENQAVLLIGASGGPGVQAAEVLARLQAYPVFIEADPAAADHIRDRLGRLGVKSDALDADLTDAADIRAALEHAEAGFGAFEMVVNCLPPLHWLPASAGVLPDGEIGIRALDLVMAATASHWRARKRRGRIVNLCAPVAGETASQAEVSLSHATLFSAKRWEADQIAVNAIWSPSAPERGGLAQALTYLASPEAERVTGQVIRLKDDAIGQGLGRRAS